MIAKSPNLFNIKTVTYGVWTSGSGSVSTAEYGCISQKIIAHDMAYSFRKFQTSTSDALWVYAMSLIEYDANGAFIKRNHWQGQGQSNYKATVVLVDKTRYIAFQVACLLSDTMTPEFLINSKIMLVKGNEIPTTYYPY